MIDEFDGPGLDPAWSFIDPVGDCSVAVVDGCAEISVPANVTHDSLPSNTAPKLLRAAPIGDDWQIVASFRSQVGAVEYTQAQGLVVADSNDATLIRCDVYSNSQFSAVAYARSGSTTHHNLKVPHEGLGGSPAHMRLVKVGTNWTFGISQNGIDWTDLVTFSMATAVAKVGVHAINAGTPQPAFTLRLDRFTDDGSMPAEPAEDQGSVVLSETFPGAASDPWPAAWTDGSQNGGSAVQAGSGVGQLSHNTPTESSGRCSADSISLRDVRITGRFRWTTNTGSPSYLAIGLRGVGGWGDEFAAVNCYAIELNQLDGMIRLLRVCRAGEVADDYAPYALLQATEDIVYSPVDTNWHRFEFEANGPWVRYRQWPDGGARPDWIVKAIDYVNDAAGNVGLAFARTWSIVTIDPNTVELADLQVYDVSASSGDSPVAARVRRRRSSIAAQFVL